MFASSLSLIMQLFLRAQPAERRFSGGSSVGHDICVRRQGQPKDSWYETDPFLAGYPWVQWRKFWLELRNVFSPSAVASLPTSVPALDHLGRILDSAADRLRWFAQSEHTAPVWLHGKPVLKRLFDTLIPRLRARRGEGGRFVAVQQWSGLRHHVPVDVRSTFSLCTKCGSTPRPIACLKTDVPRFPSTACGILWSSSSVLRVIELGAESRVTWLPFYSGLSVYVCAVRDGASQGSKCSGHGLQGRRKDAGLLPRWRAGTSGSPIRSAHGEAISKLQAVTGPLNPTRCLGKCNGETLYHSSRYNPFALARCGQCGLSSLLARRRTAVTRLYLRIYKTRNLWAVCFTDLTVSVRYSSPKIVVNRLRRLI